MARKGYRVGVAWIALNDEPTIDDADVMSGYASVHLLAELFEKETIQVARDVIRWRSKEGKTK